MPYSFPTEKAPAPKSFFVKAPGNLGVDYEHEENLYNGESETLGVWSAVLIDFSEAKIGRNQLHR
jgi:hypothetical protein|tara:strand:- start:473 stop:667 length:195 start_codon:yes stop_codon:yes gene_type:complete